MQLIPQYFLSNSLVIETALLAVLIVFSVYISVKLSKATRSLSMLRKDSEEQTYTQKQRNDFLSTLIHELRSPLSIMKGASDLILKDAHNLNKGQIEILLTQIRTSSTDMLKIVNNILDVSKIDSGKFSIAKTFGNINKILKDECDYFMIVAGVKNIKIEGNFDESVPSFNFDAERLRQVINNMLANAISVMRDGGKVTVTSKKKQKVVEIAVADLGVGISEEQKLKLFQLGVKDRRTGLGLIISKSVIKAHGGEIRVEDNKPKGSKFIFTLPLS